MWCVCVCARVCVSTKKPSWERVEVQREVTKEEEEEEKKSQFKADTLQRSVCGNRSRRFTQSEGKTLLSHFKFHFFVVFSLQYYHKKVFQNERWIPNLRSPELADFYLVIFSLSTLQIWRSALHFDISRSQPSLLIICNYRNNTYIIVITWIYFIIQWTFCVFVLWKDRVYPVERSRAV